MEKFERFKIDDGLEVPLSNRRRIRHTINAHSEAIEALMDAVTVPGGCLVHQSPRMTADEAVAIVVVEFGHEYARHRGVHARLVWAERRIIQALRDHGRDDHAE